MHWMMQQRDLQKLIVARERSLGMHTVLTAFAGHIPACVRTSQAFKMCDFLFFPSHVSAVQMGPNTQP